MGQTRIENEHVDNNLAVREMLLKRGIRPEALPPAEDVQKVKRKLDGDSRKLIQDQTKKKKK